MLPGVQCLENSAGPSSLQYLVPEVDRLQLRILPQVDLIGSADKVTDVLAVAGPLFLRYSLKKKKKKKTLGMG